MKRLIVFLAAVLTAFPAFCQSWEYWRQPDKYLFDQGCVLLRNIDAVLVSNPPTAEPSAVRDLALASLDAVLHDTRFDDSEPLHEFIDKRIARVADALKKKPAGKLEVFKVYNDGFIVRDKNTTVAFDLCGTRGEFKVVPEPIMREIVSHCDALFLSHRDEDHSDTGVMQMFIDAGKPVYASADNHPGMAGVSHIRKETVLDTILRVGGRSLKVSVLPGHQDDLQNNIWSVTFPCGKTVTQTGDQWRKEDQEWVRRASSLLPRKTDVLIVDCWMMELGETVKGFAPKAIISGHEDEMGHTIDHREAFWLTRHKYNTLNLGIPVYIPAWGEYIKIK